MAASPAPAASVHWADGVAMGLLCVVVVTAAITDVRTEKAPNWLTLPAIGVGLLWWGVIGLLLGQDAPAGLGESLLGFLAAAVPYGVIYFCGGFGGGDVKTMAAVGAISASWRLVLATTVYALLFAVLMAAFTMIQKGIAKRTFAKLFGAALMAAAKVKPELDGKDTTRIPYCVAICVGGMLAGFEILLGYQTPWADAVGR